MPSLLTWNSSHGLTIIPSLNQAYSAISPIAFISIVKSDPSSIVWSTKSVKILGGGASINSWHFASASPPEKNGQSSYEWNNGMIDHYHSNTAFKLSKDKDERKRCEHNYLLIRGANL